MDLEARKIEFIQEFLKLQNDETVSHLEQILREAISGEAGQRVEPITLAELNRRIDKSKSDFKNNRFKNSTELLTRYEV